MHYGAVVAMRMRVLVVLIGLLLLALPATPAAAGGYSSLDWEGRYLISGERAVARETQTLWPTSAAARRAVHKGDYRVYLQPGPADYAIVPKRAWHGPDPGAVEAPGRVTLRVINTNIVAIRAKVRIPDVSPGRYHTVLCTPGCARLAPDMWPTEVTVVANATEARLTSSFDRQAEGAERRLEQLRGSVDRRIRHAAVTSVNTDSALRGDIDEARDEVARLTGALDQVVADRDRDLAALRRLGSAAAASGLALLALCAGLSAALWRARRRPPAPAAPSDDGWERPADRHLVGSGR